MPATIRTIAPDFGPFTPGFVIVNYGDPDALERAITPNTCAILIEPIQGEGGVVVPPEGFLKRAWALCKEHNVLFVADEIQTGFGRTGDLFACDFDNVEPDVLIVGKALGGGYYPVSAVLANDALMALFGPGDHGSTFGGNPLASAVGRSRARRHRRRKARLACALRRREDHAGLAALRIRRL